MQNYIRIVQQRNCKSGRNRKQWYKTYGGTYFVIEYLRKSCIIMTGDIAVLYVLQHIDLLMEVFKYKKPIPKVLGIIPKFEIFHIVFILNS